MVNRDRTHGADVSGGAIFGKPHERKFDGNRQRRKFSDLTALSEDLKTAKSGPSL
jgi:hypothetical protein